MEGSDYFASRGIIAPCYFAIWRQNGPSGYFAASAKIARRGQTYKWRWRHLQAQVAPLAASGGATSKFKWRHL